MTPQSFTVVQGETLIVPIPVLDASNEPVNLTDTEPSFVARLANSFVQQPIVLDSTDSVPSASVTIRSPENEGVLELRVERDITASLDVGTYEWECRVVDILLGEVVVARGYITVTRSAA